MKEEPMTEPLSDTGVEAMSSLNLEPKALAAAADAIRDYVLSDAWKFHSNPARLRAQAGAAISTYLQALPVQASQGEQGLTASQGALQREGTQQPSRPEGQHSAGWYSPEMSERYSMVCSVLRDIANDMPGVRAVHKRSHMRHTAADVLREIDRPPSTPGDSGHATAEPSPSPQLGSDQGWRAQDVAQILKECARERGQRAEEDANGASYGVIFGNQSPDFDCVKLARLLSLPPPPHTRDGVTK